MLSPEEILNIIVAFLSENGIEYTAIMDDGRVNSAINEEQVKGVVERCFNQNPVLRDGGYKYVPSNIRDWYDFGVSKDGDSDFFIPVNIKVSVLNTDNLNCKLGIYYALTGMLPSGMSNEIQWEPFCQALHRDMNTKTDGDYYTLDDMFVSKAAERERFGEEEENQRKKAIAEHRSLIAQMEKCLYCFDSSQFPKHLIVAIGVKVRNIVIIVLKKCFFLHMLLRFSVIRLLLCFIYFLF